MIPLELTVFNFMSYQDPGPLNFRQFDLTCISGDNGVGKSSLLEAITWVLWGKARASDDQLVNLNKNQMWVELIFELENKIYKVFRRRILGKRGKSELFLYYQTPKLKNFVNISKETFKETQHKINLLLKTPFQVFINSAFLRQGRADEFAAKTPAERKDILAEILDLEKYQAISKLARDQVNSLEKESEILKFQINDLNQQILQKKGILKNFAKNQKIIVLENQKLKNLRQKFQKLDQQIKKYQQTQVHLEHLQNDLKTIQIEGSELKQELQKLNLEIKNLQQTKINKSEIIFGFQMFQKLENQNQEYNSKLRKISELKQELGEFQARENSLKETINKIQNIVPSKCPLCFRRLSGIEAKEIINHLKIDYQKKFAQKFQKIKDLIKKIDYSPKKHSEIQKNLLKYQKYSDKFNFLEKAELLLSEKVQQAQKNKQILIEKSQKFLQLKKEIEKISFKLSNFQIIQQKYQDLEFEIETLNQEISNLKTETAVLNEKLSQISKAEKNSIEKLNILKKKQTESQIYSQIAEIFSKKGLPARIFEESIPEIELEANRILEKLTDGQFKLEFMTQKPKKSSDELIETLDILIADNIGKRSYELFSGGEAFRINFAIRIALSKLLANRAGAKLQFLAIDEGFGTQDAAGRTHLVEAINAIKDDFKKILVITHISELKDSFGTRIEVTKGDHGSEFRLNL